MSSTDTTSANSKIDAGNLFNVNGLVAVITGAGSGLGAYMARALALNGATHVFILGRRLESLQKTASSVSSGNIIPIQCDVTSKSDLSNAATEVQKHSSHIDVLVCNSGISGPATPLKDEKSQPLPFEKMCENLWAPEADEVTNTYAVNLTGVHFTIAAFLPLLKAANDKRPTPPTTENFKPRPQIITTASIGGFSRVPMSNISYGPSKAGVIHLTKQLSSAFIPYDIRANVIAPGLYLSEMTMGMYEKQGKTESHNVEGVFGKEVIPATRSGDESDMVCFYIRFSQILRGLGWDAGNRKARKEYENLC